MTGHGKVDIYPVGMQAALLLLCSAWRARWLDPGAPAHAWRGLCREVRYIAGRIGRRDWRAVKSSFNGFLAEPVDWPAGLRRCGSGWTRRRALRSLRRHIARDTEEVRTDG